MKINKKGQLGLENAPTAVVLIGLTFLVMATVAFIGLEYQEAIPSDRSGTTVNQTITTVNEVGDTITNSTSCNFGTISVTRVNNATSGTIIPSSNYTVTSGVIKYKTANPDVYGFNNSNWLVTYTYKYAGTACDVNADLQTEISNNTSIAGIVLTISLVGIVLTVLVGIFLTTRNRKP